MDEGATLNLMRKQFLFVLLLPGMAGCQQTQQTRNSPELNPDPKHVVRITGRVPMSLDIELAASYAITDVQGECKPRMLVENFLPLAQGDYLRSQPLEIRRNGERFETSFVVDRYLPGNCGWQFDGVGSAVVKKGSNDEYQQTRVAFGHLNKNEPYCTATSGDDCPITDNSEPMPVIVRCEMYSSKGSGKKSSLMCQGYETFAYKKVHIVTDETTSFEVDFYDLSKEPDPVNPGDDEGRSQ